MEWAWFCTSRTGTTYSRLNTFQYSVSLEGTWGDSLPNQMLISVLAIFQPNDHQEPPNETGLLRKLFIHTSKSNKMFFQDKNVSSVLEYRWALYTVYYWLAKSLFHRCDVLRDLVPFAQFKKRGKHPWRSVTFSKVAGCNFTIKVTLLHRCFPC